METLDKIKDIIEKMSIDTKKVFDKGNHSASIRARSYAQELKEILPTYRKEILIEIKNNNKKMKKQKQHGN